MNASSLFAHIERNKWRTASSSLASTHPAWTEYMDERIMKWSTQTAFILACEPPEGTSTKDQTFLTFMYHYVQMMCTTSHVIVWKACIEPEEDMPRGKIVLECISHK
jgi:hypothetical protein